MMRKTFIIIGLLIGICSRSQVVDAAAYNIVKSKLDVIEKYLKDNRSDSILSRTSIISFLTILTGIPSESDGNFIGQLKPTNRDLKLWSDWLFFYKGSLFWDAEKHEIVIKRTVRVAPPK